MDRLEKEGQGLVREAGVNSGSCFKSNGMRSLLVALSTLVSR